MRTSALAAAVLCVAALVLVRVGPAARADQKAPNLVVVMTDDQRWDSAQRPFMPKFSKLVAPNGVSYTNGFAPNPLCCPARASTLTGDYSQTTGVWGNQGTYPDGSIYGGFAGFTSRGDDQHTIATDLHAAGYRTGLVGKYLNGYPADTPGDPVGHYGYVPPGWDDWFAVATAAYYDYYAARNGALTRQFGTAPGNYSSRVLTNKALSFIGAQSADPFFLYLAYTAPHGPATADPRDLGKLGLIWPNGQPASYAESDLTDKPAYVQANAKDVTRNGRLPSIDKLHAAQENSLLGVDRGIGKLWKALPDDTYLLFTSDNGFLWGEHDRSGKRVPYEESIRVPVTLAYKGPANPLAAGTSDDRIVLSVDTLPTLEALAGVTSDHPVEGQDLLSHTRTEFEIGSDDSVDPTNHVPPWCGVWSVQWTYVRYNTGEEELYDKAADPFELRNLAADPLYASELAAQRTDATTKCTGGTYYPPDFPTFP